MLTDEQLAAIAALYLDGSSTPDILPLLRAVAKEQRNRCGQIVEREVLKACPHLKESELAALVRTGS